MHFDRANDQASSRMLVVKLGTVRRGLQAPD